MAKTTKQEPREILSVEVPKEWKRKLGKIAFDDDRTLSSLIRSLLRNHFKLKS